MRNRSLILASIVTLGLLSPSPLFADKILLLSYGDASNDAAIEAVLQSQGDTVTIGPTYNNFTGAGLSGYNAVFLNPNFTVPWPDPPPDMPVSGQQALLNYVNQGGALVTGGMVALMNGPLNDFKTLGPALPASPGQPSTMNSPISFTSLTSDSTMNAGLASSFSFTASGYNTEQFISPKQNATAFFATNQWTATFGGEGVGYGSVGWDYGAGRILSLSTFSDNVALSNATYDQMLANSFKWSEEGSGGTALSNPGVSAPEPTSLAVFVAAGLVLLVSSRTRRRTCR
jgi:hypothetical protein